MSGKSKRFQTIDIVLCGLFAALITVGAFIKITLPTTPYPFTFSLQWLFVLLGSLLLGAKLGAFSVATYLIIGLIGVPVFAHGGGPQYVMRPGFGFLLGFLLAAFLMGLLVDRLPAFTRDPKPGFIPEFIRLMIATIIGLVAYYFVGTLYYYMMYTFVIGAPEEWGLGIAIVGCLSTFLPDLGLCVVASLLSIRVRPAVHGIISHR